MMGIDILKAVITADSSTEGYKFHCSNGPNQCADCRTKPLGFITQDIEEAYLHSYRNSVAMWISKD